MPIGSQGRTWRESAKRADFVLESIVAVVVAGVALGIVILVAHPLVVFTFGGAYSDAVAPLQILILAQLILICQMPFYFAFYALNGARWIAILGLLQMMVAVGSGYLFTSAFGAVGAAWSVVATYLLGCLVVVLFHWRRGTIGRSVR
jgi:O-antigen/teichoic acid export membrane protein